MRCTPAPPPPSQQNFHSSRAARWYLMEDLVDVVGVLRAGPEEIDGFGDPLDELTQAGLVVGSYQRPISLAFTL